MTTSPALRAEAEACGILLEPRWGGAPPVPETTLEALCALLGRRAPISRSSTHTTAFVPPSIDARRRFGVALQLYQLRSPRNLGIGDLGDLLALLPHLAAQGVDVVGLNPLHALFTAAPERASPFSPSDRRFLNPMIIAVDRVPGYRREFRSGISVPDSTERVQYTASARAKLTVLRQIFARWQAGDAAVSTADKSRLEAFAERGGPALRDYTVFEALSHHMVAKGEGAGWTAWPTDLQTRDSASVRAFEAAAGDDIAFHTFLQFVADEQLKEAQAAALSAGMAIGLYLDLAVGTAPDGAATWADPKLAMRGVRVGAPPDFFSNEGQDWGLAPLSPTVLTARDFGPYRDVLGAVMAPAGATRIDHAMGLERLFLIPDGMPALQGAYVSYEGLTDVLVEATHTHQALAIGEDLGVVPEGFRERMGLKRIFAMRILPFERDGPIMRAPAAYPADALACLSTHDLAPLEAWWEGIEIDIRRAVAGLSAADAAAGHAARRQEKQLILGLAGLPPRLEAGPLTEDLMVAIHRVVARSACRIVAVRLEDVLGEKRLVNLPGTDEEHPNWRNTLPLDVDDIVRSERLARVFTVMREVRG